MPLIADPAADRARRYSEFRASERERLALEAKEERDLAAARGQKHAAATANAMPTRTAIPQSPELRAIVGDVAELAIRTDAGFRAAMARYTEARNAYWAALWTGERQQIDAAFGAIARSTADCYVAAGAVAIQEQRNKLQGVEARLFWAERDRDQALKELEELRQQPAAPIRVELTLPTALPDLNVALRPSAGVEIIRDHAGNITGTKPRGSSVDKVAKALKGTSAGQSVVP
jgi:hypothetical protein